MEREESHSCAARMKETRCTDLGKKKSMETERGTVGWGGGGSKFSEMAQVERAKVGRGSRYLRGHSVLLQGLGQALCVASTLGKPKAD